MVIDIDEVGWTEIILIDFFHPKMYPTPYALILWYVSKINDLL